MGGQMLAWIELIGGLVVVVVGLALMLDAAYKTEMSVDDESWSVIGLIAFIVGLLSVLLGSVELVVRLAHWAFA